MAQSGDYGIALQQEQWNLLRFEMNWAYEQDPSQVFSMKDRYHHSYWALWIREGRMVVRKGGQRIAAERGEWLFLPTGKMSVQGEPATRFVLIGFYVSWNGKGTLISPLRDRIWKTGGQPLLEEKALRLCREVRQQSGQQIDLYQHAVGMDAHFDFRWLFYDWLRTWLQVVRGQGMNWHYVREMDERIAPIANYLEVMPSDQKIDVDALVRTANLSRRQFYRLFQKQYGMSPREYREQFKLQAAVRELQTTRKEIKEVAAMFGYDSTRLGLWIKRKTGRTPSQVRGTG